MSNLQRFCLGALGGFLPFLATTLAANIHLIYEELPSMDRGLIVGVIGRELILILLGGIMAALNTQVSNPLSLVQFGIAAPALVASVISGSSLNPPSNDDKPKTHASLVIQRTNAAEIEPNRIVVAGFWSDVRTGMTRDLGAIARDQKRARQQPPSKQPAPPPPPPGNPTTPPR